jgi:hypothetical protein
MRSEFLILYVFKPITDGVEERILKVLFQRVTSVKNKERNFRRSKRNCLFTFAGFTLNKCKTVTASVVKSKQWRTTDR